MDANERNLSEVSEIRVLHLGKYYPPETGGVEYAVKSIVEATQTELFHYCLVAAREGPSRIEQVPGGIIHFLKERGTFLLAPVLPSLPFVLHRLRRSGDFQVLLLHTPNPTAVLALFLSLLVREKREKIAVWHHADVIFEELWKRILYRLYRPVEEFILRRADAFVAATPNHIDHSLSLARFRDRTEIIPFAVPDSWFDVSDSEKTAAHALRSRFGGRFLLFVGRLVPYKGLDTLLRAAQNIPCSIALVGTGPLEGVLRREIAERGLQDKVLLLGKVEDLRPYYLGCEFLLLPSSSALEAFGIVQIEAMALGKPVVSSDLPTGVTYVNRDGETGLTFPAGNADALASSSNRLLEDEELRNRLGEKARNRTMREFSYSAMREKAILFFRALGEAKP